MNESIFFTQKDVVEVQLASSAIAAGIKVLLKHAGANLKNVEMLFIAGAFGNSLCIDNAKRIGLLPQIENSKIRFIGNASLTGSKLSLLSCAHREYAETLRQKTRYLNLSLEPEFQTEFENAMMFPE
ncbi:MAG: ASKHA domain-containing protein, partial [Elusimicrobiota bacterium]